MAEKERAANNEGQTVESPEVQGAEAAVSQTPPSSEEQIAALTSQLEEAQGKATEYWDQVLRAKAEVDNLRRRTERELENAHKYALDRIAQELLPVVDSMELGLAAAYAEGATVETLREGTELTLKMLLGTLEKFGIKAVDPSGEPFNPEFHQAMTTQPASHVEPNTVLNVFQKGYLLNDRLIRPALVVVSATAGQEPGAKVDEHA